VKALVVLSTLAGAMVCAACTRDLEIGVLLAPDGGAASSGASGSTGGGAPTSSSSVSSSSGGGGGSPGIGVTLLGCNVLPGVEKIEVLAQGAGSRLAFAVADAALYWLDQGAAGTSSRLYRVPVDCSTGPAQAWDLGITTVGGLAVNDQAIYLTLAAPGGLVRLPFGGSIEPVVGSASDLAGLDIHSSKPGTAYVAVPADGKVIEVDLAAKTTKDFATGQALPVEVAIDDFAVYWINRDTGDVQRQRLLPPGTLTTPGAGQGHPLGLLSRPLGVVWVNAPSVPGASDGELVLLSPGDAFAHSIALSVLDPGRITADTTDVFWTDMQVHAVQRADVVGGPGITLASGLGVPGPLVLAGSYLYFVDTATRVLARVKVM